LRIDPLSTPLPATKATYIGGRIGRFLIEGYKDEADNGGGRSKADGGSGYKTFFIVLQVALF
jgi:hypothetical protein